MMRFGLIASAVAVVSLLATATATGACVKGGGHMVSLGVSSLPCGSVGPAGAYEQDEWFATRRLEDRPEKEKLVAFRIQNDCTGYVAIGHTLKDGSVVWILVDPVTDALIGKATWKKFGLFHIGNYGSQSSCCGDSPADFPFATFDFEILSTGEMVPYTGV